MRIAYSLLSLALAAVLTWLAIRSVEDGRPGGCVSHLVSDSDCLLGQSQQLGRPCHTSASAPNGHPKKAAASLDETAAEVHKRNLPTRKREDRASEAQRSSWLRRNTPP